MVAIEFVIVVLKFASSPRAAASSLSVSSVAGAVSTKFAICVATCDSVANVSVVPPPTGVVSKTPLLSFSSRVPNIIELPLKYKSLNFLVELPKSYVTSVSGKMWPDTSPSLVCTLASV